jgi:TRAP-type uncharacterized transport system substrate-binding protein
LRFYASPERYGSFEYVNPAPPSTLTIATGFKGAAYEYFGKQYQERLARAHVTLHLRLTDGTGENLKLLQDPKSGVDIALVLIRPARSQKGACVLRTSGLEAR